MKLHSENELIATSAKSSSKLTIQANAKMFEILSSKIYTHKIAAIVRELSCNAYDSHKDSNKDDVPFKVILPNALNPYFEIEDFGLGLDHNEVTKIYTQYGNSTKNDSNDVIGAFGLGSKTPFSYSSSFLVQARKDGMQRIYSMFIGDGGEPSYSLLSEIETEECNGVKIKIPVEPKDFNTFKFECEFIFSFFKTKPEVVSSAHTFNLCYKDDEFLEKIESNQLVIENNQQIYSSLYRGQYFMAVMGGVCYPVSKNIVLSCVDIEYVQLFSNMIDYYSTCYLNFSIGDLDILASREGLSLETDSQSYKNLVNRINSTITKYIEDAQKEINEIDHPIEMMHYIKENFNKETAKILIKKTSYNGDLLEEVGKRHIFLPHKSICLYKRPYHSRYRKQIDDCGCFRMSELSEHFSKIYFVYNDTNKKFAFTKYSRLLAKSIDREGLVICVTKQLSENQLNRYKKYLSLTDDQCVNISDLRERFKTQKTYNGTSRASVEKTEIECRYAVVNERYRISGLHKNVVDLSDAKNTYYAKLNNPHINSPDFVSDGHNGINDFYLLLLRKSVGEDIQIIVMNKSNEKKIKANGIKPLDDAIKKVIGRNKEFIKYCMVSNKMFSIDNIAKEIKFSDLMLRVLIVSNTNISKGSIKQHHDTMVNYYKKNKDFFYEIKHEQLIGTYGNHILNDLDETVKEKAQKIIDELNLISESALDDYPLIKQFTEIGRFGARLDNVNDFALYIKQVDLYNDNVYNLTSKVA